MIDEKNNRIIELEKENAELNDRLKDMLKDNNLVNALLANEKRKTAELEQKLEQTEKDLVDYQFNYPTIKELQKENAELKKKCYKKAVKDYCKLEKENAELEKKLKALEGQTPWKDIKDKSEVIGKLTAAKDIMKRFVRLSNSSRSILGDTWFDTLREAEDFLKESEVDK